MAIRFTGDMTREVLIKFHFREPIDKELFTEEIGDILNQTSFPNSDSCSSYERID